MLDTAFLLSSEYVRVIKILVCYDIISNLLKASFVFKVVASSNFSYASLYKQCYL
jgi:hypothetical protein